MRQIVRNALDLKRAMASVEAYVDKHDYPVEIVANVASSKTMAQLGGLFGVWITEISQFTGESEKKIHADLKDWFLARIYVSNPIGNEQKQWVELLAFYQEKGDMVKLEEHAKRISLSWAKVSQMRQYMDAIHNHFAAEGLPLQPLEKG